MNLKYLPRSDACSLLSGSDFDMITCAQNFKLSNHYYSDLANYVPALAELGLVASDCQTPCASGAAQILNIDNVLLIVGVYVLALFDAKNKKQEEYVQALQQDPEMLKSVQKLAQQQAKDQQQISQTRTNQAILAN